MVFGSKISKNFAWELTLFHKVRSFSDGIDFLDIRIVLDLYKGDHTPRFTFFFEMLNFTLIEFNIYNINHIKEED